MKQGINDHPKRVIQALIQMKQLLENNYRGEFSTGMFVGLARAVEEFGVEEIELASQLVDANLALVDKLRVGGYVLTRIVAALITLCTMLGNNPDSFAILSRTVQSFSILISGDDAETVSKHLVDYLVLSNMPDRWQAARLLTAIGHNNERVREVMSNQLCAKEWDFALSSTTSSITLQMYMIQLLNHLPIGRELVPLEFRGMVPGDKKLTEGLCAMECGAAAVPTAKVVRIDHPTALVHNKETPVGYLEFSGTRMLLWGEFGSTRLDLIEVDLHAVKSMSYFDLAVKLELNTSWNWASRGLGKVWTNLTIIIHVSSLVEMAWVKLTIQRVVNQGDTEEIWEKRVKLWSRALDSPSTIPCTPVEGIPLSNEEPEHHQAQICQLRGLQKEVARVANQDQLLDESSIFTLLSRLAEYVETYQHVFESTGSL